MTQPKPKRKGVRLRINLFLDLAHIARHRHTSIQQVIIDACEAYLAKPIPQTRRMKGM